MWYEVLKLEDKKLIPFFNVVDNSNELNTVKKNLVCSCKQNAKSFKRKCVCN